MIRTVTGKLNLVHVDYAAIEAQLLGIPGAIRDTMMKAAAELIVKQAVAELCKTKRADILILIREDEHGQSKNETGSNP